MRSFKVNTYTNSLTGIPSAIADNLTRAELAKAGIPAFQVIKEGSEGAELSIVGLLHLSENFVAVYTRADTTWLVTVTYLGLTIKISKRWWGMGDDIAIDNEGRLVVGTQEGLNKLKHWLPVYTPLHGDSESTGRDLRIAGFNFENSIPLPEPVNKLELAQLEMLNLRAYGRAHLRSHKQYVLLADLEAIKVAEEAILRSQLDRDHQQMEQVLGAQITSIKHSCAQLCSDEIERCSKSVEVLGTYQSHGMSSLIELEWWLTQRSFVLPRNWRKEIASNARRCEVIRFQLFAAYSRKLDELTIYCKKAGINLDAQDPRKGGVKCSMAILAERTAQLSRRLGHDAVARHFTDLSQRLQKPLSEDDLRLIASQLALPFSSASYLPASAS
jgi:hypothetical protein